MDKQSDIFCLEHSEKEKAAGRFPYHVRLLLDGRHENHFYDTDARGWHIVFVGPSADCFKKMDVMIKREPKALGASHLAPMFDS
jgi:hypothetical protein